MNSTMILQPAHTIRCGNLTAVCWLYRDVTGAFYNTTISRSYLNKSTNQWERTCFFTDPRDLLAIAHVAQKMCQWINQNQPYRPKNFRSTKTPELSDA